MKSIYRNSKKGVNSNINKENQKKEKAVMGRIHPPNSFDF